MNFRHSIFAALALTLLVHDASAQERKFGAWSVGVSESKAVVYAGTNNESNGVFGQFCQSTEAVCSWVLINSLDCEVGSKYSVLVNSDAGAAAHETTCFKVDGKPRHVFTKFDEITATVLKSSKIAVAFPVGDSQFQVSRFSLSGSNEALDLMGKTGRQMMQKNKGKDTRDQML